MGWEFATALDALVGKRGRTKIMRAALGDDATPEQIRDGANYLSRIIAGRVDSPGYERLRLIAAGLGYETLSAFFLQLERSQSSTLKTETPETDNPLSAPALKAAHGHPILASPALVGSVEKLVGRALVEAGVKLAGAPTHRSPAPKSRQPAAKTRAKESEGGKRRHGNR